MFCKTITYTDFNGLERKENFYFHFSEDEIIEMELTNDGGFSDFLKRIIDAKDQNMLIKEFKKFVLKAYGEKSTDGRRFIKSDEISKAFSETPAYTTLYMELAFNSESASKFVNALIPPETIKEILKHVETAKNDQTKVKALAEAVDANLASESADQSK